MFPLSKNLFIYWEIENKDLSISNMTYNNIKWTVFQQYHCLNPLA